MSAAPHGGDREYSGVFRHCQSRCHSLRCPQHVKEKTMSSWATALGFDGALGNRMSPAMDRPAAIRRALRDP